MRPTRLGVGWLMKDGHGGPINKLAAARANEADLAAARRNLSLSLHHTQALKVEQEVPKTRKSKAPGPKFGASRAFGRRMGT